MGRSFWRIYIMRSSISLYLLIFDVFMISDQVVKRALLGLVAIIRSGPDAELDVAGRQLGRDADELGYHEHGQVGGHFRRGVESVPHVSGHPRPVENSGQQLVEGCC